MSLDIQFSKDGYRILKVDINEKKRYLGSKYNQKREIEKFVEGLGKRTKKDNYIVLGFSFGEHIKELLEISDDNSNILIVELNDELKEICIKDENVRNILSNPRVTITKEKEQIREFFIKHINEGNINYLKASQYCNYYNLYLEELKDLYAFIKKEITRITINRNTSIAGGEVFLNNFLCNLKYIAKAAEVNKVKEKYINKPAIIVSAGPSLSKNIDVLNDVKNALILSGGRTLRPLLERGISPSCVGIVDSSEVSYKLVEEYIDRVECPLYFNDSTPTKVIEEHKFSKFFSIQNEFVGKILKEEIPALYGGGSIAHNLTLLAIYMGCNPIIFIGQDLAYTGDKGHASFAENKWQKLTFDNFYKDESDIYIEDLNGNQIRTSITLNNYRLSMEDIIEKHKKIKFINATEGGANIKGAENKRLEDVLKELENEEIIPIDKFLTNENRTNKMIERLLNTLNAFNQYIRWCEKAERIVKQCRINYNLKKTNLLEKNKKDLQNIESKIKNKLDEIIIIDAMISKVVYSIENCDEYVIELSDSENIVFNKEINKIEALYSALKKVIVDSYGKVEMTIKGLKEE
ncbi:hypothetical protein CLPUN_21020 [Clostridium puniceum]|uniref:6-hydroxymethylpterin diphosphokinase MptE-like domain-containing protein n=1 Tax=Clostridium puniceum TaxID=29367 RepID=A0A1S8TJZ7_9CLOT|nr:6-hydroxymethylpterin diphosphokinase MptE-like protein [Clostridium puniceum]OOM77929.1 hypothetical protein CLPUN_21020 [Clostridium puniceum]